MPLKEPSELTQRTLQAYDELGVRSHQYQPFDVLKLLFVYSELLTHCAVG